MSAGAFDEIDGRINPLAGMGLTGDQYNVILQGMANVENFPNELLSSDGVSTNGKRGLEDNDGGRDGKKVWLKVIEQPLFSPNFFCTRCIGMVYCNLIENQSLLLLNGGGNSEVWSWI